MPEQRLELDGDRLVAMLEACAASLEILCHRFERLELRVGKLERQISGKGFSNEP